MKMKTNFFPLRTLFFGKCVTTLFFSLLFLLVGTMVLGQTVTYTVSTTTAVVSAGTLPSGSSAVYAQTFNTAKQLTSGTNAKLTLAGYAGKRITGITLEMRSNTSSGKGSFSVVAGSTTIARIADNAFNSSAWYGSWSTSYVDVNVSPTAYSIATGQNVVLTIAATANSLYIQKFTITYENATTTNYTLTYDANGGTGTAPAAVSNASGTSIALPSTTLTRSGYSFSGWNTNSTGNGTNYAIAENYTMPSDDSTLFARWAYTVTYNGNGSTSGAVPAAQINYNSIATTVSSPGTLLRTGYTFGGWKTAAAGSSADYLVGSSYVPITGSATKTLYAHWIANTATLTVSPSTLSGFTYSVSNGPSPSQNFTITGNTLDGSNVDILPGNDYEISLDNGATWADYGASPINVPYTGSTISRQISVRLKAGLAVGNYNNSSNHIIVVEGGGVVSGPKVTLSGIVTACVAPTTQSVVAPFTGVGTNAMTVNLTSGNGVGRVVVINTTNSFTNPTSSNTLPLANAVYAGSGQQFIYAGSGNSVAVTGLSHSTTYYVRVYEYNICSGNYTYNTTTQTNNPRSLTTLCELPVNPAGEVDLENPYCGSATLVYQHGSAQPQAGVTYYWQTNANGTSTANPVTNIYTVTSGGVYYVRAYNGNCWSAESYLTQAVVISSAAAVSTQPTNQNAVVGTTATFTVVGTGSPNYQWQLSTNNGTTWTNISGATSASYTTPVTTLAMNGYRYRVRLSNSCNAVTSNVVVLSVVSGPCFEETFNAITAGNNTNTSGSSSAWLGNANFPVVSTAYQAGGAIRIGTTSSGTITSRALSEVNGNIRVELDVKGWTTVEGSFNVTLNGVTKNVTYTNKMADGFETKSVEFENVPIGSQLEISTTRRSFLNAVRIFCEPACTPATINATPDNGPANTVVIINGSNFTSGSTVKFGTIEADVEYISATQLKAIVPASANGNIIVDTALDCDSETAFTLIKQDASGCEVLPNGSGSGNAFASDLIFYEVYDENGGTGGIVSIYNGTNATVDLTDYSFYRTGNIGDAYSVYGVLSGSVLSGELAVIGVSGSRCGVLPTGNGNINNGFNDNDGFQLRKNSGNTIVDEVLAPNYSGYYLKRKAGATSPKSTYDENDWTINEVGSDECLPSVATETPAVKTVPPVIATQPTYAVSCEVTATSLALTATEGHVGGNALSYQWYVLADNGTAWTAITNAGVYSGAQSATLIITNVEGLNNFQYYCQVRKGSATCFTATNATQIKEATNIWETNTWSNGTPILASKVIIEGNYDTQVNGILDVCELTVNPTGTMRVKPNHPIKVKNKIINNNTDTDSFVVESDANLIQTDNIANEGSVKVERNVMGMNNDASVAIDYVYWSSPVSHQPIKAFSSNTPASGFQEYRESNDRFVTTADANFILGKGYAIRAENVLANGYNKTYSFTGVPHNGNISTPPLLKSEGADKGYNLVGNPYPSNIDFDQFHALNSDKIYASAFFWTNNTYTAQQMGSGYKGNNYAIYNITGGVPATYDKTNPNYAIAPNGKIKVGQAFIVQSKIAGALDFNNSMRVVDDGTFYQKTTAKNRFWLSLTSPNNLVNTILIGYISGATDSYETDFDSELFSVGSDSFYSILGARKLAIQGKENNFQLEDVVPVGNAFSANGNYTIALQTPEGIFKENQNIYLKDKLTNKYINLSTENSYTFEALKGTNINRFDIVYKEQVVLGTDQDSKSQFEVYKHDSNFVVRSSKSLGRVEVYDASGRLMMSQTTSEKTLSLDAAGLSNGIYIIKVENSGEIKTKKILK